AQASVQKMRNGIGVEILGNDACPVPVHGADDHSVIAVGTHHVLVKHFYGHDTLAAGDNLNPGFGADIFAGDQGAGVVRFKSVFDTQRNIHLPQSLCSTGMDGFHAKVSQLVSHVVICAPDGNDFFRAYQARISAAEVEFLVNDGFFGVAYNGKPGESHFAIAAIKGAHHALRALAVASDNGQFISDVHFIETLAQLLIQWQ